MKEEKITTIHFKEGKNTLRACHSHLPAGPTPQPRNTDWMLAGYLPDTDYRIFHTVRLIPVWLSQS
jgi:hypothetical protein